MKHIYLILLLLLLPVGVGATSIHSSGCGYVCYSDKITYPVSHQEYVDIVRREPFTVEKTVEKMVRVYPPAKGEHDCLDYKKWDSIAEGIDRGDDLGYYMKDGKLYTSNHKRYLRCNDPDNPYNFKKIVEKVLEVGYNEYHYRLPVTKYSNYEDEVIRCYYYGDHGMYKDKDKDKHHDTSPVPEPSTLMLFGVGILCLGAYLRKNC